MKQATLYHRASGAILSVVRGPDNADFGAYATAEVGVYEAGALDRDTQYVIDGSPPTVGARTAITPTGVPEEVTVGTTVTASGLPDPCWLGIGGEIVQRTGGSVSFVAQEARVYSASLRGAYRAEVSVRAITETHATLDGDARWTAVRAATPAQIDAWLTANVTNLAQARDVLKLLLLAVRKLGA